MKAIVILIVAILVFGTAGYYGYELFVKPKQEIKKAVEEEAKPVAPTPTPKDPSLPFYEEAMKLKTEGKLVEASESLRNFISNHSYSSKIYEVIDALGEVNTDILFSDVKSPDKDEYVVVSGDTLGRIASRNSTTAEMIMRVNDMSGTMLRIGDRLMIPTHDFSLRIYVAAQVVDAYDGDKFFKRYKAKSISASAPAAGSPKQLTVTEKIAWKEGERVAFGSKEFPGSTRWIMLSDRDFTLYSDGAESGDATNPGRGVELRAEDAEELHTMLRGKASVTVE